MPGYPVSRSFYSKSKTSSRAPCFEIQQLARSANGHTTGRDCPRQSKSAAETAPSGRRTFLTTRGFDVAKLAQHPVVKDRGDRADIVVGVNDFLVMLSGRPSLPYT